MESGLIPSPRSKGFFIMVPTSLLQLAHRWLQHMAGESSRRAGRTKPITVKVSVLEFGKRQKLMAKVSASFTRTYPNWQLKSVTRSQRGREWVCQGIPVNPVARTYTSKYVPKVKKEWR